MEIVEIVKFNDRCAFVFDEMPAITYEKHGDLLIGSDDSKTIIDCLHLEVPKGRKEYGAYAFGGREFDLPMKDGTTTHCWGQWWEGRSKECGAVLGFELCALTASTKDKLKNCYVFNGYSANRVKLEKLIEKFNAENPDYEVWEYNEYGRYLRGLRGEGGQ